MPTPAGSLQGGAPMTGSVSVRFRAAASSAPARPLPPGRSWHAPIKPLHAPHPALLSRIEPEQLAGRVADENAVIRLRLIPPACRLHRSAPNSRGSGARIDVGHEDEKTDTKRG